MQIAHIINPVLNVAGTDLILAQPVTFSAMQNALSLACQCGLQVEQLACFFQDESFTLPSHMRPTRPLAKSILACTDSHNGRRLPLIHDILYRAYEESEADYLIYTNVDIAPMPQFYSAIQRIIDQGYDAFIINRRTLSSQTYTQPSQLPLMYTDMGTAHPGSDCFVFKRDLLPRFILGKVVIGAAFFGLTLRTNLMAFAHQFHHFKDLHLTFHIGDDRRWNAKLEDAAFNCRQAWNVFKTLETDPQIPNPEALQQMKKVFVYRAEELSERLANRQQE